MTIHYKVKYGVKEIGKWSTTCKPNKVKPR